MSHRPPKYAGSPAPTEKGKNRREGKEERRRGRKEDRKRRERNFWLTYFTCQGGAGMLIHVVTVHIYVYIHIMCINMGT